MSAPPGSLAAMMAGGLDHSDQANHGLNHVDAPDTSGRGGGDPDRVNPSDSNQFAAGRMRLNKTGAGLNAQGYLDPNVNADAFAPTSLPGQHHTPGLAPELAGRDAKSGLKFAAPPPPVPPPTTNNAFSQGLGQLKHVELAPIMEESPAQRTPSAMEAPPGSLAAMLAGALGQSKAKTDQKAATGYVYVPVFRGSHAVSPWIMLLTRLFA
jgi:hypothetical protein